MTKKKLTLMQSHSNHGLECLFNPGSIALAGISTTNPGHWTRGFLESLIEFKFPGPIYLVNRNRGTVEGFEVYPDLLSIPGTVDYVISIVPAREAPKLVEECARKGVKAVHFCTAGFGETAEENGSKLENELAQTSRTTGVRVIGPNCMGIYCPQSYLSFDTDFPKENGSVALVSQSGGNATYLVRQAKQRGVRFSKVISYGNGVDLNESDFLEYLASDINTEIITLYIEGAKDGTRFRQALERATKRKTVVLLKGGVTEGGARTVTGHTGALAGSNIIWDSLCKQVRILRVRSLEELVDTVVTLSFLPNPKGRNVALIGMGGGASVRICDEFEQRGLRVPAFPEDIRKRIRGFTPSAGNILINPIDYSQTFSELQKLKKTMSIVSRWEGVDFLILFLESVHAPSVAKSQMALMAKDMLEACKEVSKPIGIVIMPTLEPEESKLFQSAVQMFVSARLPVYHSFGGAANAINAVITYYENEDAYYLANNYERDRNEAGGKQWPEM